MRARTGRDFVILLLTGLLASGAVWIFASAGEPMGGTWILMAVVCLTPGLTLCTALLLSGPRAAADGHRASRTVAVAAVAVADAALAFPAAALLSQALGRAELLGVALSFSAPALLTASCGAAVLARWRTRRSS